VVGLTLRRRETRYRREALDARPQRSEIGTCCGEHTPVELDHHGCIVVETIRAGSQEPTVRVETIPAGEDRAGGLAGQVWITVGLRDGKVGQVRHDDVDRTVDGPEQVAVADGDAIAQTVAVDVYAREGDRAPARVRGHDARIRCRGGDRNGDRARARADIDDARVTGADARDRSSDELPARFPRRHHFAGARSEREAVEDDLVHSR
jgi:hypothetical protein